MATKAEAAIYARVSTAAQASGGYSLPAQLATCVEEARAEGLDVPDARIFVEAASASRGRRPAFEELMAWVASSGGAIVVDELDRLIRTHRDRARIEEVGARVYLARDRRWWCPGDVDGDEGDYLAGELKTLLAVVEGRKKRARVRKGMLAKARGGVYPSTAPIGYLNHVERVAGDRKPRRSIILDPERAEIVAELFERYATEAWSFVSLAEWAAARGLRSRRGVRVSPSGIERILCNPFYMGDFEWCGETFQGAHERLASPQLFQRCQEIRTKRGQAGARVPDHVYSQLVRCGHCGGLLVWQTKRQRHGHVYTYGRCKARAGAVCGLRSPEGRKHLREEEVDSAFQRHLAELRLPDTLLAALRLVVRDKVHAMTEGARKLRARLQRRESELTGLLQRAMRERIAGDLDPEDHQAVVADWKLERREVRAELVDLDDQVEDLEEAVCEAVELASGAHKVWRDLRGPVRRRLAAHLARDLTWVDGELRVEWHAELASLGGRTRAAAAADAAGAGIVSILAALDPAGGQNPAGAAQGEALGPAEGAEGLEVDPTGRRQNLKAASVLHVLARRRAASPELREALEAIRAA